MKDKPQTKIEVNNSSSEIEIKAQTSAQEDTPTVLESFANSVGGAVGTAVGVGAASLETAVKQTHKLIEQATHTVGEVVTQMSENWLIRKLAGVLNLNWLIGVSEKVDLAKAEAEVKQLQQQHPQESPSQIAHRIMLDKATKAGGIGLATSLLPGQALALFAVDLAATTQLQSEMLYQIASIYGLDLKDPARKGEALAIFGLAFGGSRLLKAAGLGLLRNVPFAGAVIGASSNATMIYSLGYAACRFYEAKLDKSTSLTSEATLAELKKQSENYLEKAIAQEAIMDQILVHMILASHPDQTWEEISPKLQTLNLSPSNVEAIAQNIKSPQPLDTLLNQLNRDFAVPLLAQCYRIAQLNNKTTLEEARVIKAISSKFNLNVNSQ
ncbi:MAG: EcsC family protein [Tolypothrix brevis GSE-NOS-MK-07-07A]|jgi:uncharacterized protein (DUF697 family)|nr:EcsC family protein [Tolypothrix brevis GSE-NOS-MK-07-07A]